MTPDGQAMQVTIPNGVAPGQQFQVQYQPLQMVAAPQPLQMVAAFPPAAVTPAVSSEFGIFRIQIGRTPGQMLGLDMVDKNGQVMVLRICERDDKGGRYAAAGSGLRVRDVVTEVAGQSTKGKTRDDVYALIGAIPPSEPVVLTVDRPLPAGADPVQSPPPPGCAPEGFWAHERYCGPTTCMIFFAGFPCICCFPQDTRRVYMLHGKKYDAHGNEIVESEGGNANAHQSN